MPTANGERRPAWQRWPVAAAMIIVAVVWFVPMLVYRHTGTDKAAKLKAITDTRTALVVGLAGLAALVNEPFPTWPPVGSSQTAGPSPTTLAPG